MIFDIRVEIEDLHDFKEIKALFEATYSNKKIYEVSLLNVD